MSKYVLPAIAILLFIMAAFKRKAVYDSFAHGAREGLKLVISIFPYICAIFVLVALFKESGVSAWFCKITSPVFSFFGIPPELSELMLIRPLSGNGSIAMLENIYVQYGADSYIARCGSVIVGCSETIFYITAVYFSTVKIKKLRFAIPISVFACFAGSIVGCLICRLF